MENKIPIVVGVTGHRQIREQDRTLICNAVRTELIKLRTFCPHSPLLMLSSLAEGGDLLCADVAEELGISLMAVLPRPCEDYRTDFSKASLAVFDHHCARAKEVFVAPRTEEVPREGSDRSDQFRQAGIYVAAHSHVLFALWDGGPGNKAACGTDATVKFALNGAYLPADSLLPRSAGNKAVIHVFTPRGERCNETAGNIHVLGSREALLDILKKTDEFNEQLEKRT